MNSLGLSKPKRFPRDGDRDNMGLAERAYQLILDQILQGSLQIGAILSRRHLAEQLKMSLLPVAEALQRLENEGLVESRPRAGTRVRIPTDEEIRGRFEIREALECQAARLCAERASLQERLELKRSADNLDALLASAGSQQAGQDFAFATEKYHVEFHMRIADYAHSPVLRDTIEKSHVLVFNWLYNTTSGTSSLPRHFHAFLTEVISSGDVDQAEKTMREHVRYGLEEIQRVVAIRSAGTWRLKRSAGELIRTSPQ